MISIIKQNKGIDIRRGLTYVHDSTTAAQSLRTRSQMQRRIMKCMQSWLFKLFVALVTLQIPNAIAPSQGTGTRTETETESSMEMEMAVKMKMKMAMIPGTVVASSVGNISSAAYKAIKPIGIKATNETTTKIIEKNTITNLSDVGANSHTSNNDDDDDDDEHNYQNQSQSQSRSQNRNRNPNRIAANGILTTGFMTTLESPLEKVQDFTQNLSSTAIETMTTMNTTMGTTTTATTTTNISTIMTTMRTMTTRPSTENIFIMAPLNVSLTDQNETIQTELEMNISFHEYCLMNRYSFADLLTIILYSIVCIIGLFGNTLVIYVVLRFSKMQTVTNIYILNLAIADECFLIGIPFLLYTMRICSWTFGEYMCKAYMVSTSITQFTSSIFLLIMSADRFIAVCHPIASPRYRTIRIAKFVSAIAWLTSAILMLPVVLFASTIAQEDGIHHSCNIKWPETHKHTGTTFILYTFFLGFATPLCFILCFYYLVIKKLHAVGRKHKSKEKKRSHRKVTRLVLTVITVYVLCWLPQWVSQVTLINTSPDQSNLSRFEILIFLLLGCLAYSNSAMNPILYAFLSDNFRKSFSKAFTCMAGHEVNAQLQMEPSVFTKHGGSRRRGSKRLIAQSATKTPKTAKTTLISTAPANNNSSTTTSSTTTQADKHVVAIAMNSNTVGINTGTVQAISTAASNLENQKNDLVASLQPTKNGIINTENIVLVLVKQETATCSKMNEQVTHASQSKQMNSGSTLQTDL